MVISSELLRINENHILNTQMRTEQTIFTVHELERVDEWQLIHGFQDVRLDLRVQ